MTNIEIIENSGKIKTIEDILENIDLISDLLREDVARIIASKGGYTDYDFEQYYSEAIRWTKIQLEKHHLKIYKRIFKCGNIKAALRLLLVRITSNVKNQFVTNRKGTVAYHKSLKKREMEENVMEKMNADDPLNLLLDQEMQILVKENDIQNLNKYKKEIAKIVKIKKNQMFFDF